MGVPKSDSSNTFARGGGAFGLHNMCHNAMVFQLKRKVVSLKMGPCGRNVLAYRSALMKPCVLSEASLFSSRRISKSLSLQHVLQVGLRASNIMDDAEFNLLLDKATFKPQTNSVVELYRQRVSSCIVLHLYVIYSHIVQVNPNMFSST